MRTRHYLLLLAIVALPRPAMAACLLNDYSVQAEYDRSAAVVTGQVVAEHAVAASGRYFDGVVYTVKIEVVYRGDFSGLVDIFSENSSGRFPMQLHERYLLFIYRDTDRLAIDNCGNSGPVSEKTAELRAVRRIASHDRNGQNPNSALHAVAASGRAGERDR